MRLGQNGMDGILISPATLETVDRDELRAWRRRWRLTAREAARRLGIPEGTYRHYEQGDRRIPDIVEVAIRAVEADLRRAIDETRGEP